MHRIVTNCPKGLVIDHINNNPLDNRKINLRTCTQRQNTNNSRKPKSNTSGYKGVYFDKIRNKYRAYINDNYRQLHLGYFTDIEEAAEAYNKKATELYKEFANLNIIKKDIK